MAQSECRCEDCGYEEWNTLMFDVCPKCHSTSVWNSWDEDYIDYGDDSDECGNDSGSEEVSS